MTGKVSLSTQIMNNLKWGIAEKVGGVWDMSQIGKVFKEFKWDIFIKT